MVHHKSGIKVQNNKERKNMHNSLNLKLFCTYSKKRNLREVVREREKTLWHHYFHLWASQLCCSFMVVWAFLLKLWFLRQKAIGFV